MVEEELKPNVRSLEKINNQIENSTNPAEKAESFREAEKIEAELDKIEKLMGISADEIMSFYETMTPDDAKDVVSKTIEKIPLSFMKGALFTVDNLDKVGGKIMLIASMRFPREAALIAASIMILVVAEGSVKKAIADESVPVAITLESNREQDKALEELEVVSMEGRAGAHNGLVQRNQDGNLEPMQTMDGEHANQETFDKLKVNRKATYKLGPNTYGNEHTINNGGVEMGKITID